MKASIFVLVDALGWEWIKEHPFLKEVAPYRRPLDSVLGFSTAAIPSILTGRFPEEHGRLSLFHRANGHSPFAKLKLICAMPPAMVENRYVRYGVKTVARRMNHLSGYFQLYGIPLSYLPKLDVCEKRNIYAPGGIPDSTSIFDLLQGGGKSYKTYCYHDGTDDQLLARIEADLVAGQANFYFLYLAGLDAFLHAHADDREASAGMLEKYSSALARLYGIAEKTYGAAEIHVFGDHGMAPTEATIDIQAILARLPVKAARDYLCLLDSTMARFWFFSPRARELVTMALNDVDGGEWLEAERPGCSARLFCRRKVRRTDIPYPIGDGNRAMPYGRARAGGNAWLPAFVTALAVGIRVERRLRRQPQTDHRHLRRHEGARMRRRNE